MNPQLRSYLESIGLRSDATDQQAWDFFNQLQTPRRETAQRIQRGEIQFDGQRGLLTLDGHPYDPAASTQPGQQAGQQSAGDGTARSSAGQQAGVAGGQQTATEPGASGGDGQGGDGTATAARSATVPTDPAEVARQERQRISQIQELAGENTPDEAVRHCIDQGLTVEQAGHYILRAERAQYQEPVGQDGPDVFAGWESGPAAGRSREQVRSLATLAAGLAARTGGDPVAVGMHLMPTGTEDQRRQYAEQIANEGDRFRSDSLADMCRQALQADGRRVPSNRYDAIRASVSTGSFSNVMAPALNARLMMAFEQAPDTTSAFTTESDVPDFRVNERHRLGKTGALQKRHRGSAASHGTLADNAPETYKVFEYAEQIFVDEQDIVDDRLDVFQRWPQEMGLAAARLRPDLVYFILLNNANMADGNALFSGSHNNDTPTSALDKSALESAIAALRKQTEDSVNLDLQPANLIMPPDLEQTGRELLRSQMLIAAGNTDTVRPAMNRLADLGINPVVDARLANGVTDPDSGNAATGSTTTWFLTTTPNQAPLIEVGFLAGRGRQPDTDTFPKRGEDGYWGTNWVVRHTIGAKALTWHGMVRGNT